MVIAGKVAIAPKGKFVYGEQYERLDAVRYENGVYVAKKDNISVYPTIGADDDNWMFMVGGAYVDIATDEKPGIVKPDNVTTFVSEDGTMSAKGGGGEGGTTNYPDLDNLPQINGVTLKGNKSLHDIGAQPEGDYLTEIPENYVTQQKMEEYAQPKGEYALISESGFELVLTVDSKTYVMEIQLKNKSGNVISSQDFDFPIETAFTNVEYDKVTHEITFTLQNGNKTDPIDISDIIRGLVPDDRTIAGLNLKEDITTAQLKNALELGNVNNTADKDKSVKYAESAGSATTASSASKVSNALTFTGGASGSYDGSAPMEIEIPKGSVDILATTEEVEANIMAGKVADALVTKNMIINAPEWIFNEDGSIKAYKTKVGADTVFPFSKSLIKTQTVSVTKSVTASTYATFTFTFGDLENIVGITNITNPNTTYTSVYQIKSISGNVLSVEVYCMKTGNATLRAVAIGD